MSSDATPSAAERVAPAEAPARAAAAVTPKRILRCGDGDGAAEPRIESYDFRNPAFLSEAELRRLRLMHEEFVRHVGARLSLHLRMEFGLKIGTLSTTTYSKFTDAMAFPTHVSLFKAEPLVGVGILDLNPRLALAIADRLLGGRGQPATAPRYLTEIETALIEEVILIVLEEWAVQWKSDEALRPLIIGHENNGRFLQTSPRDAIVLGVALDCVFGDCGEQFRIGVPYYTIEPLVRKMHARRHKDSALAPAPKRAEWQRVHENIMVPVRAQWDAFQVPVREIVSLRLGDVLELPATICSETRLLLNGSPKFVGTVGLDAGRVAVQLTRKLSAEDSSHGKPVGRKDA